MVSPPTSVWPPSSLGTIDVGTDEGGGESWAEVCDDPSGEATSNAINSVVPSTRRTSRGYLYRMGVGFNPYRKYRATSTDYILIGACFLIGLGLLAWAFLG